jgi:ComEC/Rec2-related protein
MRRPLLWPALLFALGVALGESFAVPSPDLLLACAGLVVAAAFTERLRWPLLLVVSWLAGWAHYRLHQDRPAPHDLRTLVGSNIVLARFRAEIRDTPALKLVERRGQLFGRTLFRVRVTAWENQGTWQPATGDIAVSLKGSPPRELFRTQRLELHGLLRPAPGAVAPGLFDYATHLRHQGCWFMHIADGPQDWRLAEGAKTVPPLSERFLPWAQKTLARGLPDDEATRLLWAMALGWKTALTDEVDTIFMESGTMHVFAISGLHIALIASVIVALLRAARLPRRICGLVVIPLLWFYVAATGWQTSAIRSVLMSTVVIGGWMLERPVDLFNSLALALLAVLLWDPGQLFQASFQLSFGVVAGMALLVPALEPRLLKLCRFDPDPFLPEELRPRWQRWLELPLRKVALLLAASLAAQCASLPLTVHYFHLLNPVSLLANLLVVPMSAVALAANVASLAVGELWPALGELFNASGWLWMRGMIEVSRQAAEVPGGVWYVASPSWPWWLPYYAALVAVGTGWAGRESVRRWFALSVVVTACVALWVGWQSSRQFRLTVLPGGKAIIADAPGRANDLLIDAGNESTANAVLIPFLRAQGWNRVPRLLITHGDLQHVGGTEALFSALPVNELVLSATNSRSPAFRRLLTLADEQRVGRKRVFAGDNVAGWRVLHPARGDRFSVADDGAVVLQQTLADLRVTLLSDLGKGGQSAWLNRDEEFASDITIAGLPRAGEPLGESLFTEMHPGFVLVASADYPVQERVKPATRSRLERGEATVWFSEDAGTVQVLESRAGLRVQAMDGRFLELPRRNSPLDFPGPRGSIPP